MWLDAKYLNPFFTRRLTQEVKANEEAESSLLFVLYFCDIIYFSTFWYAKSCPSGPFTRSNPDEVPDQQVVRRGPPGAVGLRGRWGWNRTSVNTFSSHESEDLVWIFGIQHMKRSQEISTSCVQSTSSWFECQRTCTSFTCFSLLGCFMTLSVGTSQNFICRPENGFYFQDVWSQLQQLVIIFWETLEQLLPSGRERQTGEYHILMRIKSQSDTHQSNDTNIWWCFLVSVSPMIQILYEEAEMNVVKNFHVNLYFLLFMYLCGKGTFYWLIVHC